MVFFYPPASQQTIGTTTTEQHVFFLRLLIFGNEAAEYVFLAMKLPMLFVDSTDVVAKRKSDRVA